MPAEFTTNYYGSTFVDTNDSGDLCGFGLVKSAPETIKFRIVGNVGGSANSSGIPNFNTKEFVTRVAINVLDPAKLPTAENNNIVLIMYLITSINSVEIRVPSHGCQPSIIVLFFD